MGDHSSIDDEAGHELLDRVEADMWSLATAVAAGDITLLQAKDHVVGYGEGWTIAVMALFRHVAALIEGAANATGTDVRQAGAAYAEGMTFAQLAARFARQGDDPAP